MTRRFPLAARGLAGAFLAAFFAALAGACLRAGFNAVFLAGLAAFFAAFAAFAGAGLRAGFLAAFAAFAGAGLRAGFLAAFAAFAGAGLRAGLDAALAGVLRAVFAADFPAAFLAALPVFFVDVFLDAAVLLAMAGTSIHGRPTSPDRSRGGRPDLPEGNSLIVSHRPGFKRFVQPPARGAARSPALSDLERECRLAIRPLFDLPVTMLSDFNLGDFVVLAQRPEWGVGQIQSVIGDRVTVNFEHAGKQMINTSQTSLLPAPAEGGTGRTPPSQSAG